SANHATHYMLWLGCWPSTPEGVLASIVAAGLAQKSFHLEAMVREGPFGTTVYSTDVSRDSASERVNYAGSTMNPLVFGGAAYVKADALLLEQRLGLTLGQAGRYAGRWIWVPRTDGEDRLYAELTRGLALALIVGHAARMKDLTVARGTKFL